MAKLIVLQGDQHRIFELHDQVVTIGRAPENMLWLDDPSLSRRHCELRRQNGQWWLQDNGSFNGTFVNNLSVQQQVLRPGDRIQLGVSVCYYVPDDAEQAAGAAGGPVDASAADEAERAAREATSRKLRNFMSLLEITKAVNSELSKERLLSLVVLKSIELVAAQRGFLVLLKDGKRVFEVALFGDGKPVENPEKQISTSVLESVTTPPGEPVITINAQNDLGGFMSIVALEVRSLICVPLKMKEGRILGALYVDSQVAQQQFGEESLNLLQAFADQAAIALENATLYDEVLESREQEKHVRTLFQRYVPADVVNQVLNLAPGTKLSQKLTATVLFSDIRSFTSISEKLTAEEVVTFLNDYLQRMVDIVFDEGGIVDKFVGDAVMAVWGAPSPKPDDARRAVRASLRMIAELDRFNADQRARGAVEIDIGIGLHTGSLIAGNVGSDKKMEYTVIGDTVNVASRVEGLNKQMGTHVLITEQVCEAVGEGLDVRAMPLVDVKGKAEKLQVYEVLPTSAVLRETADGVAADAAHAEASPAGDGEGSGDGEDMDGEGTLPSITIPQPVGQPATGAKPARPSAEEEPSFDIEF